MTKRDRAPRASYPEAAGLYVHNAAHLRVIKQDAFQELGIPQKIPVAWQPALPQTSSPMANTFFDPGDQRAAKVHELFSRIAPRYDLINDLQSFGLHRYWKRRVVRLARPQPGQRALDLCCGTGDLALALARRGAQVAGLDFSEQMLDAAQRRDSRSRTQEPEAEPHASRSPQHGSPSPRFVRGDAQRIPFPDNSFDIVTIGYGLRNLANWEMGLREMRRVANPGGRLVVLDFGKPDNALWRGLYFGYLKLFVPWLGRIFCGSAGAYAYILESLKHYPAQHAVAAKMRELGLANVRVISLLGGAMSINYGEKPGGEEMD
jgi:demethylmenaquinone methyltransferase/2-methoxy-6-polyprenyl-1,4-benzoquinol methylase